MITYSVYYMFSRNTRLGYVGYTSQPVKKRMSQHLRPSKNDVRQLADAVRRLGPDEWDIMTLYKTPVKPEAEIMERAFIQALDTLNNGYNSQCGPVDSRAIEIAADIGNRVEGHESLRYYQHVLCDDFPVVAYSRDGCSWVYGHPVDKNNWWESGMVFEEPDLAFEFLAEHGDMSDFKPVVAMDNPLDTPILDNPLEVWDGREFDADALTPLKALTEIQLIIRNTDFSTQDDVEHFFSVLSGLKSSV